MVREEVGVMLAGDFGWRDIMVRDHGSSAAVRDMIERFQYHRVLNLVGKSKVC